MARRCPCCGCLVPWDDPTIDDHGLCIDCHKETLMGERCAICWETDHITEDCPELDMYSNGFEPERRQQWHG